LEIQSLEERKLIIIDDILEKKDLSKGEKFSQPKQTKIERKRKESKRIKEMNEQIDFDKIIFEIIEEYK
jgi:hypothetical protein